MAKEIMTLLCRLQTDEDRQVRLRKAQEDYQLEDEHRGGHLNTLLEMQKDNKAAKQRVGSADPLSKRAVNADSQEVTVDPAAAGEVFPLRPIFLCEASQRAFLTGLSHVWASEPHRSRAGPHLQQLLDTALVPPFLQEVCLFVLDKGAVACWPECLIGWEALIHDDARILQHAIVCRGMRQQRRRKRRTRLRPCSGWQRSSSRRSARRNP